MVVWRFVACGGACGIPGAIDVSLACLDKRIIPGVHSSSLRRQRALDFEVRVFGCGEGVVDDAQLPDGVNVFQRLYIVDDRVKEACLLRLTGQVLQYGFSGAQDFH